MFKTLVLLISSVIEKTFPVNSIIENRYRIIRHLGSGSYGHSYLVLDERTNRQFVLKALRFHKRITSRGRKGFSNEISLLKSVHHPGLPAFIAEGNTGKIPFVIMEYIDGKTFEQIIFQEGKSYSEIECFIIAAQLLEVLDYLHHENIIHRDVRIPNIMMADKRIKVIDMGLAKRVDSGKKGRKQKIHHPRKQDNVQSDYYGLGHFILFLLYSSYTPQKDRKEGSWEEELGLSNQARMIIRKLLQIDPPYESGHEIKQDFRRLLKNSHVKG